MSNEKQKIEMGNIGGGKGSVMYEIMGIFARENYSFPMGLATLFATVCTALEEEGNVKDIEITMDGYLIIVKEADTKEMTVTGELLKAGDKKGMH